jgi:hypothetical protein
LGDFLKTFYGKAIATLTIIALLMGIGLEVIQINTAYWTMRKVRVESLGETTSGCGLNPAVPCPRAPKPQSLAAYRAELRREGYTPEKGFTKEDLNEMAVRRCKHDHGDNDPLCKE